MPLARYFLFVGGVLLALLILADTELPKSPVPPPAYDATVDLPTIRIHSDRKWPERVVFDTSAPAIRPVVTAQAVAPAPVVVAELSPKIRVRDAFAQLRPSDLELKSSGPSRPQLPAQQKRKVAKKRVAPPMLLMAQQPQFGFMDRNTW